MSIGTSRRLSRTRREYRVMTNNMWDVNKLKSILPDMIIDEILRIPISRSTVDTTYWALTQNNWIPVELRMKSKGFHLASKCLCCCSEESLLHVQLHNSDYAKPGHIRILLPLLIMWFLWVERNDTTHRELKMYHDRVIWRIMRMLRQLYQGNLLSKWQWKGDIDIAAHWGFWYEQESHGHPKIVYWSRPLMGEFKLNAYGSSKEAFQNAAGGGVLRDHTSTLIFGFFENFGRYNSIQAELMALHRGLLLCNEYNISRVWIEMDAKAIVQMLHEGHKGSSRTRYLLSSIRQCLSGISYRISHIHRQGNQVVDYLSNKGHTHQNLQGSWALREFPH
ncbi:Ribonuclease H domain - like 10 [Theobroma cacao]|nr:Ribonuclease H domain - like 10 [Theobroma cacao]